MIKQLALLIFVFLFGFSVCLLLIFNVPTFENTITGQTIKEVELIEYSPSDWIHENDLFIENGNLVIQIKNITISRYADTGSMVPTLDVGASGLRIVPQSPASLKVGDIISYRKNDKLITHRIISKGVDEEGYWFITKGDRNSYPDEKIYFEEIRYVLIGILY